MKTVYELGSAIDAASDEGNEELLRQLGKECEGRLSNTEGEQRVFLRYFQANTFGAIIQSKSKDSDYLWNWEQPDSVQNLLLLRQAIAEEAFETIDPILACQIRTNLASRLNALGRPVAANEQLLKVLEIEPKFAKALANRGNNIAFYAKMLYDSGHKPILLSAALSLTNCALDKDALWESNDRDSFAPDLMSRSKEIASYLDDVGYDDNFDLNQWSLGETLEERSYRRWCLKERLFLNPLNEAYTDSVAARDILHLPSHTYNISESPRFPAFYNLMKLEYVSARYRLYRASHENEPDFVMRDVLLLEGNVSQALGYQTADLRSAFQSAYAIFDKIGLFMNDYFQVGLKPGNASFRKVWSEKRSTSASELRTMFKNHPNWPLRALYFLSKDLFEDDFRELAEPDAANLSRLRNQIEHRFLSLQHYPDGESDETHKLITVEDFQEKTLRILKMAHEALSYLSLAMHREETLRPIDGGLKGILKAQSIEPYGPTDGT